MSDRAVSSPVGVILIIGMTIASVASLFAVGGAVISDTRADAEQSQMENAMSSFSSKASLVGLGESGDQRFSLGRASEGDVTIQPDAGTVTLKINSSEDATPQEINSTSLGAIVYQSGDTEIAYQGGGVWRKSGGYTRMISPPEYHYQLSTLTFPIMTVRGAGRSSGSVRGTVETGDAVDSWYPVRHNETLSNPLDNGTVSIEVESRYCTGWESFFRERSQGSIAEPCDEDDTVVVDLVVPFSLSGDEPVIARNINPTAGEIPEGWSDNTAAPSISPKVEDRIKACEGGGCSDPNSPVTAGEYNVSGATAFDGMTFNTTDGNIIVAVDGDLSLNDITIEGDNEVTLYVRGDLTVDSDVNDEGDANQLVSLVHSDGNVNFDGNSDYTGIIYAPKSEITFSGAPAIEYKGALIAEVININGQSNKFDFESDPALDGYQIVGGDRPLTYLHVSENTVEVDFG